MGLLRTWVEAMRAHPVVAVVLLALVLRLGVVAATPHYFPAGDGLDYLHHGISLAQDGRYPSSALAAPRSPSAFRPPAYPYALAGVFAFAGPGVDAARSLNAVLGALSAALAFLIASELWGRREGVGAGVLTAVYPPLVLMSGVLLAENLFVPLVLGSVLACLRLRTSAATGRWALAAGAFAAGAVLTRSNGAVVMAGVLTGVLLSTPGPARRRVVHLVATVLAAVVVMTPWTVRNAAAFEEFVPVSTGAGLSVAGQFNPVSALDGPTQAAPRLPDMIPQYAGIVRKEGVDEVELDRRLRADGLAFAADSPRYVAEAVRLNVLRTAEAGGDPSFVRLWDAERDATGFRHGLWVGGFWVMALAALAAVALPATRRRVRKAPLWVWLIPSLLLLTTLPVNGKPRYRLAVDPFVILVASVPLAARRSWAATPPAHSPAVGLSGRPGASSVGRCGRETMR